MQDTHGLSRYRVNPARLVRPNRQYFILRWRESTASHAGGVAVEAAKNAARAAVKECCRVVVGRGKQHVLLGPPEAIYGLSVRLEALEGIPCRVPKNNCTIRRCSGH